MLSPEQIKGEEIYKALRARVDDELNEENDITSLTLEIARHKSFSSFSRAQVILPKTLTDRIEFLVRIYNL